MIQRDANGEIYIPGRITFDKTFDALDGALPSWLTFGSSGNDASSVPTFGGSGPDAYFQMQPTNVAGRTATLAAASIDLTDVSFLRLIVRDLVLSNNSLVGYNLGAWDDSALYGGRFTLPTATSGESPYITLGSFPISSSTNPIPDGTNYAPRNNAEYKKPRTLSYIMTPQDRCGYALEGDTVFASWRHPRMDRGVGAIPRLRCTTQTTSARYLRFRTLRLIIAKKG